MSLEQLFRSNHLLRHTPTKAETTNLFAAVDRNLADARVAGLSADNRFGIAYHAALGLCTIALYACGYRDGKGQDAHHWPINSLEFTLGPTHRETMYFLSTCARQRGQLEYDRAGVVDSAQAQELIETAVELREEVIAWLKAQHADLLPDHLQ
jgi:hypothetical protein